MADKTDIGWTEATWNVITGCSVDTPGCTNCYAMHLAGTRLKNHPSRAGLTKEVNGKHVWNGEVRFNEMWLDQPFRWRRPREIFVCAHADLFHPKVPFEWLDRIFGVMALTPHTYQVLTKRSARMREYAQIWFDRLAHGNVMIPHPTGMRPFHHLVDWLALPRVLPNVHFGVSCEDQKRADLRVPDLLLTPAAKRFISAEPLLGPIDFTRIKRPPAHRHGAGVIDALRGWTRGAGHGYREFDMPAKIGQVITGGESGKGDRRPRPVHVDAFRSIRDQCKEAGTAFFHKQNGSWLHSSQGRHAGLSGDQIHEWPDGTVSQLVGTKAAGAMLDGVTHEGRP